MKTIILCGGKGTRYDADRPKSLAMIGNKPIIHHLMDIYDRQGYSEFILCLGWKQEDIIKYFMTHQHKFIITFVDTGQESHTAKRLKLIENYIPKDNKNFFCNYCDGLANVNLTNLEIIHITNRSVATLTAVRPTNQFGTLEFNGNGNVTEFKEKPKLRDYINGGYFTFNRKIFDYIDLNKNQELEKDILTKLAKDNQLGAYKHDNENSFWETLNTTKDEINLNNILIKCTKDGLSPPWLNYDKEK